MLCPSHIVLAAVSAALSVSPLCHAQSRHYVYDPNPSSESWRSGSAIYDGYLRVEGNILAEPLLMIGMNGRFDSLTWTYMYQLRPDPDKGPGFSSLEHHLADLDELRIYATTLGNGGGRATLHIRFLDLYGSVILSRGYDTGIVFGANNAVISGDDLLGTVDDVGCIGGFRITLNMERGDGGISQIGFTGMDFQWGVARIVPCLPEYPHPCGSDFNGDGFIDFFDFDAFVACFRGGACPPGKNADFNGDEFIDFFDLDDFQWAFEHGC